MAASNSAAQRRSQGEALIGPIEKDIEEIPSPPAAPSVRTRARILEAAAEAFATRGYHGATIRLIAAEAGVDPALPFRYFDGKAGLFEAALQAELSGLEEGSKYEERARLCRLLLAACWAPVDLPRGPEARRALAGPASQKPPGAAGRISGALLLGEAALEILKKGPKR